MSHKLTRMVTVLLERGTLGLQCRMIQDIRVLVLRSSPAQLAQPALKRRTLFESCTGQSHHITLEVPLVGKAVAESSPLATQQCDCWDRWRIPPKQTHIDFGQEDHEYVSHNEERRATPGESGAPTLG